MGNAAGRNARARRPKSVWKGLAASPAVKELLYAGSMDLPEELRGVLLRFKEAYGPEWAGRLRDILEEEVRRKEAGQGSPRKPARVRLSLDISEEEEEELRRFLEGRGRPG